MARSLEASFVAVIDEGNVFEENGNVRDEWRSALGHDITELGAKRI